MLLESSTQYFSQFKKLSHGHRTGKVQFSFQSQRRAMPIVQLFVLYNCVHFICKQGYVQNLSKLGFSSTWTKNFQMYKLGLEKAEEPEAKLPTFVGSWESKGIPGNIHFCFFDYDKAFVWITINCGKFFKRWEYQTILPVSWETCIQVKKQQLEPDMEQWTGLKLGKGDVKPVDGHSAHFQSTSCKMKG